jgi:multidrug efflux pump subunit AcrA (membrane-fusion protein)
MYVSVELVTDVEPDAVLVPKQALIYDADQIFVFRYLETETETDTASDEKVESDDDEAKIREADGRVERLLVEARLEDRDNIEVGGALAEGDQIVIAGQAGLKDGSLVRLVENGSEPVTAAADDAGVPEGDDEASL